MGRFDRLPEVTKNFLNGLPEVTKNLLIVNCLVFFATFALDISNSGIDLNEWLGLHYWKGSDFHFYQFFTYMFMHSDFSHLFFNMFSLFMLGHLVEMSLGSKFFLLFYLITGVGAGFCQELAWTWDLRGFEATFLQILNADSSLSEGLMVAPGNVVYSVDALNEWRTQEFYNRFITVGASGSVFGLLAAIAMLYPNLPMYLMFIPIPIKAKYMMIGYGLMELFLGVKDFQGDNVAHFAHLGGALFGVLLILLWRNSMKRNRQY